MAKDCDREVGCIRMTDRAVLGGRQVIYGESDTDQTIVAGRAIIGDISMVIGASGKCA